MDPPRLDLLMTCMNDFRSATQVDSSPLTITSRIHSQPQKFVPVESKALNEVAAGSAPAKASKSKAAAGKRCKATIKGRQASMAAQAAAKLLSPPRRFSKSRRPLAIQNAALFSKRKCITAELLITAAKKRDHMTWFEVEGCGADIVYINLSHRTDRRRSIEEQLAKHQLTAWRSEASRFDDHDSRVVTRTWDSTLSCKFDKAIMPARLSMSNGEIGCATSHAVLWHTCAMRDDDAPALLVLEDDAMLYANFCARARKCIRAIEAVFPPKERQSLLFLGAEVMQWRNDSTADKVNAKLNCALREADFLYQTSSYVIWPAAARKLLSHLPINAPVDVFISRMTLERHIRSFVVTPKLACQKPEFDACSGNGDIEHTNVYK
ncbi:hypothetical protein AB1Y20_022623 [Prymnesium parvum]|uniref:Glycosyl transferase family 25 domain-containing protein n=1 Tax=Prymnesium parvum TaxID=97485 RepID=A0AB34JJD5_PRYPA